MEISHTKFLAYSYMRELLYAQGAINALEPDSLGRYPDYFLDLIATELNQFTESELIILSAPEVISEIIEGEHSEVILQFGNLSNYLNFQTALNEFFLTI